MLLPYFFLIAVALVIALVALGSAMFGKGSTNGSFVTGAWLSLIASIAIMIYAVFAASATHGGASQMLTYGLIAVSVAIGLASPYLAIKSMGQSSDSAQTPHQEGQ